MHFDCSQRNRYSEKESRKSVFVWKLLIMRNSINIFVVSSHSTDKKRRRILIFYLVLCVVPLMCGFIFQSADVPHFRFIVVGNWFEPNAPKPFHNCNCIVAWRAHRTTTRCICVLRIRFHLTKSGRIGVGSFELLRYVELWNFFPVDLPLGSVNFLGSPRHN